MSFDGSIELVWAGDARRFRLGIAELIALEAKRNAGSHEIATRLGFGLWRVEDVTDTIRIALLGGGEELKAAVKLIEDNVRPGHSAMFGGERMGELQIGAKIAGAVLSAAITGVPEEPVGKKKTSRQTKKSASPPRRSTATA